jgi:hypothetical protein
MPLEAQQLMLLYDSMIHPWYNSPTTYMCAGYSNRAHDVLHLQGRDLFYAYL